MARHFGQIEERKKGQFRAKYTIPRHLDTRGLPSAKRRITAPMTFRTYKQADIWLSRIELSMLDGTWVHPDEAQKHEAAEAAERKRRETPFGDYAKTWVSTRTNKNGEKLRPKTRAEYSRLLTTGPLAHWADTPIDQIRPEDVRSWRAELIDTRNLTQTARAYDLMKSILKTAVEDKVIDENPCRIPGGSRTSTGKPTVPPTDEELDTIIKTINPHYRALVVIAAAGGLRYGEVTALTTRRVTVERAEDTGKVQAVRIAVVDAVTHVNGRGRQAGATKSDAGVRTVAIFGNDARIIAEHMEDLGDGELLYAGRDGGYLSQSSMFYHWERAREAAGRPDLAFHTLRHYAGTRYAQAGATTAEVMARLGHSNMVTAMRYQHAGNRDDELAQRAARG